MKVFANSDGEYIIPVEFHIKEFNKNSADQNKLYVSITLGKIKIENKIKVQVAENSKDENQWRSTPLFSKISIPQLVLKINHGYPRSKNGTVLENVIKIAISQGRFHIQSLLNSNIGYILPDEKRVQDWLNVNIGYNCRYAVPI